MSICTLPAIRFRSRKPCKYYFHHASNSLSTTQTRKLCTPPSQILPTSHSKIITQNPAVYSPTPKKESYHIRFNDIHRRPKGFFSLPSTVVPVEKPHIAINLHRLAFLTRSHPLPLRNLFPPHHDMSYIVRQRTMHIHPLSHVYSLHTGFCITEESCKDVFHCHFSYLN